MSTQLDDLADVGPFGPLTAIGWERANLETRSRAIVAESQMRIAGAAEAIISVSINMDEGRQAALMFVAHCLRDTARLLERLKAAEWAAAQAQGEAEELRHAQRKAAPRAKPAKKAGL